MDLKETRVKLYIMLMVPTIIIAIILFAIEFTIAPEPPIISTLGFVLLLAIGGFTYFSGTKKAKETQNTKECISGYLIFIVPTAVVSTILFIVVPPSPPYLLVYGLVVLLTAYSIFYVIAIKKEVN